MPRLSLLLAFTLLSSCAAFSIPKTPDELKHAAESTSLAKVENFSIPNSALAEVRTRLNEYAERCLSMQKVYEQCAIGCTRSKPHVFTPKVKSLGANKVQLTLQRNDSDSLKVTKLPKDGMYVMVAEAESSGGKVTGHIWSAKFGYGDISGSTKGWMTGDNKTCPSL